jgi:uncharacterized membrane protein YccC
MLLSERFKFAFRVALAVVLAYGIALSMDWGNPRWAAYAVLVISLSTTGQSIEKGVMRMLGTLLAVVVSLTLVALFPQDRWWMIAALSAYVALCTYLSSGPKRQYMWFVAGFVSVIICFGSIPTAENAFDIAILRTLQTGLGILCYTLVALLLWPVSTGIELDTAVRELAATQYKLFRGYVDRLEDGEQAEDVQPVRMQEVQQLQRMGQALTGAREDTYEVWEMRWQWERYERQAEQVMEALERWRESFEEVRPLDLETLIPDYRALIGEINDRFGRIEQMLAAQPPEQAPKVLQPSLNRDAVRALSQFERAALALFYAQLRNLESLTGELLHTLAQIKGFAAPEPSPTTAAQPARSSPRYLPDPDRLGAAAQVMVTIWLGYLVWLYVEIPGGIGAVTMASSLSMAAATQPYLPMRLVYKPLAVSAVFAAVVYIFLMPRLSGFLELGSLIFVVIFAIGYLFHEPQQFLGRIAGVMLFTTMTGIANEQTYSFLSLANMSMMTVVALSFVALGRYFPFSPEPHRAYLRLVRRFFRSCEYLSATLLREPGQRLTWLERCRDGYHLRELATLPEKIGLWARFIPPESLGNTRPEQLQALTANILSLGYRMREIVEARAALPFISPAGLAVSRELQREIETWRAALREIFRRLARNPDAGDETGFRSALDAKLQALEEHIKQTLNRTDQVRLSGKQEVGAYRLLGAHRGLSEAVIAFTKTAGTINWPRLREERF